MSPSRILIGQFLIVLTIIVATMWGATQWVAHAFGYQPALGRPWFIWGEVPVYRPWRLFQWWYAYEAYAPDVFARGGAMAASGGLLGILAAVLGSVWRSRWEKRVTTYGSARWAEKRDLVRAKLLGGDGVFLGRWKSQYLRHDGPEHVLAFAPTRSGKGVGLVVPTLLSWTGSAVVHDIKGENWDLTSGWRSGFGTCLRFDPTDARSPRFNPLMEVRKGAGEVRDVQNIADILVDPEGSLERRSHWEKTGHALLVGVILHVLYAEEDKTLAGCARFLSDPSRTFEKALQVMLKTKHVRERDGTRTVHPVVAQAARERPVSLYLVVPPSDLSRTKPLVRLILNQIGRRLTEALPQPGRRKLLLMLDEFPALGRLDFFESALAFMAGYGVRAYLIAQSLNQIEKAYGPTNAILDNCHVRIAFATNDERTAKRISEALGAKTELRSQKNYTGHRLAPWLSHMMVSRQETQRALMTPGEVMQMAPTDEVVMVSGTLPILAKKLRYFEDRNFTGRVLPAASVAMIASQIVTVWTEMVEGGPATVVPLRNAADEGGRDIAPVLDPPERVVTPEHDQTPEPELDDTGDAPGDQALETIRRAAALDLADDDTLPEF